MATKTVKTETEKFTLETTIDRVKKTATEVNKIALTSSEDLINEVITRGEQWQGVTTKAIDCSIKLIAKQQDIVFDALESVKSQLTHGRKRLNSLFSKN